MQRREQVAHENTDGAELPEIILMEVTYLRWHRPGEVSRHPIRAEKDPVLATPSASNLHVDQLLTEKLASLMKVLFPHDWVGDALYLEIATRAMSLTEIAQVTNDSCSRLESILGICLLSAPAPALLEALQRIDGEPVFKALLAAAIRHFYDDPRIWGGCGYEGVHGCRGVQQRIGIDDAAWLPNVAVEETK